VRAHLLAVNKGAYRRPAIGRYMILRMENPALGLIAFTRLAARNKYAYPCKQQQRSP
jgi:hypothetical protein